MPKNLLPDHGGKALKKATRSAALEKPPTTPAKKRPKKHAGTPPENDLERAYCHLGRAAAVAAELQAAPREFVSRFLEYGAEFYLEALSEKGRNAEHAAFAAAEVLRTAEHIALASLYAQNRSSVPALPAPKTDHVKRLQQTSRRIDDAVRHARSSPHLAQFTAAARELLRQAEQSTESHETQLAHEFLHAAEALTEALSQLPEE